MALKRLSTDIRRTGAFLCCLLLVFAMLVPALAEETKNKTVRVGYVNSKGYMEGGEDGYKTGSGYEYLQKISYYTGWRYEYVYGSFNDLLTQLEKGDIDLLSNVTFTAERAKKVLFSTYSQNRESFYILANKNRRDLIGARPKALDGSKIGVLKGTFQLKLIKNYLSNNGVHAEIVEMDAPDDVIAAMEDLSIDAAVLSNYTDNGYYPVKVLGSYDYYFAVNSERADILVELNAAMQAILNSDPYYSQTLSKKYSYGTQLNSYLSAEETVWLAQHDNKIRVGYLINNMPYSGKGANGELTGVLKTVLDNLSENFGIKVETLAFESLEVMGDAMFAHEIDCYGPAFGDFYISEIFTMIQTDPIVETTPVVLYRGELSTKDIAVTEKSIFCQHVTGVMYPDAVIHMYETTEDCMNAVKNEEVDCMIITSGELNVLRKYEAMEQLSYAEIMRKAEMCLFTNLEDTALSTILNKAISLSETQLRGATFVTGASGGQSFSLKEYIRSHLVAVLLAMSIAVVILGMLLVKTARSERRSKEAQKELQRKTDEAIRMNAETEEHLRMIRSLSGLFFAMYYIDLRNRTFIELSSQANISSVIGKQGDVRRAIDTMCEKMVKPEYSAEMRKFMNIDDLDERLKDRKSVSMEYIGATSGWSRALLISGDRDENGKLNHVFYAARMIHDEKAMEAARNKAVEDAEKARKAAIANAKLAEHDALTGALNRTAFNRIARDLEDNGENLALLLVDVDCFKTVNDSYGHDIGDEALIRIAELLRESFRSEDCVIRYGGDEFMVLMRGIEKNSISVIRNKVGHINRILQDEAIEGKPSLSISVGAAFSQNGYCEELFLRADRALYRTKEAGRCGCSFE